MPPIMYCWVRCSGEQRCDARVDHQLDAATRVGRDDEAFELGADAEAETSQWFTPGWDEKDRRKNPYAREDDKQGDN